VVDKDDSWLRQLAASLGVAAVVALVGGLALGGVALGAANVLGLAGDGSTASSKPSLYIPPLKSPTHSASPTPSPTPTNLPPPTPPPSQAPSPKPKPQIVLSARPQHASSFERIYLSGSYRGGEGRTLQVQRFQGGWSSFPVTTTVRAGSFSTYVQSGNSGPNRFRVVDPSTGRASNQVSVVIG
jgi:hypothetical protein